MENQWVQACSCEAKFESQILPFWIVWVKAENYWVCSLLTAMSKLFKKWRMLNSGFSQFSESHCKLPGDRGRDLSLCPTAYELVFWMSHLQRWQSIHQVFLGLSSDNHCYSTVKLLHKLLGCRQRSSGKVPPFTRRISVACPCSLLTCFGQFWSLWSTCILMHHHYQVGVFSVKVFF